MEQCPGMAHTGVMTEHTPTHQPSNRLTRPRRGRIIAGVAAALAERTGVDVGLVRLGFVVSLFFGGLGVVAYVAGWLLIPEEGQQKSTAENMFGSS